jgi:hypothetical protein
MTKRKPDAGDTAATTMSVLTGDDPLSLAEFLKSDVGAQLYADLESAKAERAGTITKKKLAVAWDNIVTDNMARHGGNRWKAGEAILKTEIGRQLYRRMTET